MADEALTGRRILVVDDEAFARRFLVRILGTLDIEIAGEAEDGEEALRLLAGPAGAVDAIITDIEMPRLDGFELVRRIRFGAIDGMSKIPILMLTGRDTPENNRSARIHKIDGFIVKPPSKLSVAAALRIALRD